MNYILIITLLTYVGVLQLSSKFNTKPVTNATIAVALPYVVGLILKYIYVSGYGLSVVENLFPLSSIVSVALQFIFAIGLFYKIQNDASIGVWMTWAISGFFVMYFLVPFLVTSVIQ